jgi:hypothetical protein
VSTWVLTTSPAQPDMFCVLLPDAVFANRDDIPDLLGDNTDSDE